MMPKHTVQQCARAGAGPTGRILWNAGPGPKNLASMRARSDTRRSERRAVITEHGSVRPAKSTREPSDALSAPNSVPVMNL